jgi:ELWxxDGT repeat protein
MISSESIATKKIVAQPETAFSYFKNTLLMNRLLYTCLLISLLSWTLHAQVPYQIKIINTEADARPERLTEYNGKLLFRARTPGEGVEPWISDGTEAGTFLLKDINDNPSVSTGNSNPDNFTVYNGLVFFKARDASNGDELWVSDGTTAGTTMLKNIHPTANGNPIDIVIFQDLLFFTANDGPNSSELWVSDGTEAGTQLFLDINPGPGTGNPAFKTVIGDQMYFAANNGTNGTEIWVSDGTVAGTRMVKDIRPGSANSLPSRFFAYNGEVYFRANDGTTGNELWKTDGTEAGTVLVQDIRPGSGNSSPDNFFISGGLLYFTADDGTSGVELWVTDGTSAGTRLAYDFNPSGNGNPANFTELIPGLSLLSANDGVIGNELWSMVAVFGITLADNLVDLNPGPEGSNPSAFIDNGYTLYFSATTALTGRELFRLDADSEFPVLAGEANSGEGDGKVEELLRIGSRIFFRADNGTDRLQLWAIDAPLAQISISINDTLIQPESVLDFGDVSTGSTVSYELTISNTGDAPLLILNEDFNELVDFSATLEETVIGAGEATIITFSFSPADPGEVEETVVLLSLSVNDKVFPIILRGNGVATAGILDVSDNNAPLSNNSTLNFGTVIVGNDSIRTLTLRNAGNGPLEISAITLNGANFSTNLSNGSLSPGSTVDVSITFTPTLSGLSSGTLSFTTNDPGNQSYSINLSGQGQISSQTTEWAEWGLEVFPNPVSTWLHVKMSKVLHHGLAQLYDHRGQLLSQIPVDNQDWLRLDMKPYPSGWYQLRLADKDNSITIKLIKP